MKKFVVGVVYACCMLTSAISQDLRAQTGEGTLISTTNSSGTTSNLITSGTTHTWTGVTTGSLPSGCATAGPCPGGPTPLYDPSTNTINFSYNAQATVAQTIAINQALANVGAGVKINGYNYSYDIRNMNGDNRQSGTDTITVNQALVGTNNSVLLSSSQYYNTKFEWQTVSGTQNASTPIEQAAASYLRFSMTGGDNGYWGGYFGPQVRNVSMSLNFGAAPIKTYTMPDDGWINVPLQFGFPYYGKVFTNSFMFDNGVVGFFDPVAGGCNPGNGWCGGNQWNAQPFSNSMNNQFSYMIAPMWADIAPTANTTYQVQGDSTYQKYMWNNVAEYYSAYSSTPRLNTFGLEIRPSGFIGASYGNINLQSSNVGIGTIGNPALGEYNQIGFHPYGTVITGLNNWSMTNTPDACTSNPLTSPSCPGYTDAMCSVNPLYSQQCPGYQQAYFTQQCSSNPLYSPQCPGYAMAYLDLQCSANPLYSTTCQGYQTAADECSSNPLSHSYCTNYQTASQQCSINPLYGSYCPGYTVADTECSTNPLSHSYCTNYQIATTQCSTNPLYANYCPNYQTASQQCSSNPLYASYCPGYEFAYQCSLDGLYSNRCPNYSEAYAKKNVLGIGVVAVAETATTTATTTITTAPATTTESITTQLSSGISDSTVSSTVSQKATTANADASPASAVKLTPAPSTSSPTSPQQVAQNEPKKDSGGNKEEKKDEGSKSSGSTNNSPSGDNSKPSDQPKSTREAIQERRREAAAKEAVAKGKDLANEMGKASDMEAQKAVQNVVIQAMGFTPGFDTYNKAMLPDSRFYAPKVVYGGQVNVDNKAISRRLMTGSDRLHQDMVDSQYNRGND